MSAKLLIAGSTGRMGREVAAVAADFGFTVFGGIGRGTGSLEAWVQANGRPDVIIDFSLPEATIPIAQGCAKLRIPLVSGVTGIGDKHMEAMLKASQEVAVLWSANMSVGIQMMIKALDSLKGADGFDIYIEETHHRGKRDRPSGTAVLLGQELNSRTGRRPLDILSLRAGGVVGQHRLLAISESESLIFEHNALNRAVFARGACLAARWILTQQPGFYRLQDAL